MVISQRVSTKRDHCTHSRSRYGAPRPRRRPEVPDDLMDYNGLEGGSTYYPGLTLTIPSNARAFIGNRALQYHPSTYSVEYGDTLYSIACLYGDVDPRAIAAVNDLDLDQTLTPGTVLQIP